VAELPDHLADERQQLLLTRDAGRRRGLTGQDHAPRDPAAFREQLTAGVRAHGLRIDGARLRLLPELTERSQPDLASPVASEFHRRREEPDDLECDPWLVPAHGQLRRQRHGDRVPHRPVRAPVFGRDESRHFIFGYFLVREEVQHARQRRGRLSRVLGASPRIGCRVQRALALVIALLLGLVFKVRLLAAQDPQLDPPGLRADGQDRAVPPAKPLLTPLLWLPFSHLLMLLERADQVPHPDLGGDTGSSQAGSSPCESAGTA